MVGGLPVRQPLLGRGGRSAGCGTAEKLSGQSRLTAEGTDRKETAQGVSADRASLLGHESNFEY